MVKKLQLLLREIIWKFFQWSIQVPGYGKFLEFTCFSTKYKRYYVIARINNNCINTAGVVNVNYMNNRREVGKRHDCLFKDDDATSHYSVQEINPRTN